MRSVPRSFERTSNPVKSRPVLLRSTYNAERICIQPNQFHFLALILEEFSPLLSNSKVRTLSEWLYVGGYNDIFYLQASCEHFEIYVFYIRHIIPAITYIILRTTRNWLCPTQISYVGKTKTKYASVASPRY